MHALADDLFKVQCHLVDTAWREGVGISIPQAVYQKYSKPGNRFERLLAPFYGDVAWRHDDRTKQSTIAVNV
jgi:hypothetical protein